MSDIIITDLCKSYGDRQVFKKFSIRFAEGRVNVLMGESGCGKTTLLKIIMGLTSADSGEVEGVPKHIAAVFQENRLCETFSAAANIRMVSNRISDDDVSRILIRLGLDGEENTKCSTLSGGMKRRIAIARALLAESELLILDEPFKGLDEDTKKSTAAVVSDCAKGKTVIMVTHDENEARLLHGEVQTIQTS